MQKRIPRGYQQQAINEYFTCLHAGYSAPVIILPTGGGKTMIFSTIVRMMAEAGHTCLVVCHRSELVRQISMNLAMEDIHHDFICSDKTRAICGNVQQSTFGRTYYRAGARVIVASVQTINSRIKETDKMSESRKRVRAATLALLKTITFGVFDESHHLLRDNTFGRPVPLMPLAKYLLVTATPTRTDGRGMGSVALGGSGIVDVTIMGPQMRWLIDEGYLCDYKIFEPPTEQADFTKIRVTKSGDYNLEDQAHEMNKATITGDVVRHYKEMINGKLTIVFCCDIAHATSVADAYQSAGISAAVLHGGDDELTRFKTLQAFERREILVLVTVDLVSEGFDLPAIEAAQFLRRTMSLSWWIQAFGRVLRPSPGKDFAYILDHVGNWREQGLPDKPREWPMADRKGGQSKELDPDDIPVTRCRAYIDKSGRFSSEQCAQFTAEERNDRGITICGFIYEITNSCCPECGQHQPLAPRGEPIVDKTGKLVEVSAEELAKMRAGDDLISDQAAMWRQEIQQDLMLLQMTPEKYVASLHSPKISHHNHMERHRMWRQLQAQLKTLMDEWMQYHQNAGIGKEAAQDLFLRRFGTNVYYAQVLRNKECGELMTKIEAHLAEIHEKGSLTYN